MFRFPGYACLVLALGCASPMLAGAQAPAPVAAHGDSPTYGIGTAGEYAVIDAGSQAPDFSFETSPGWTHLRDVRGQGHVLLLIGPDEGQLLALERERPRLLSMGVVPVAVLDRRAGACRALAGHLHLGFLLVPDARRVIGAQFNALDPSSRADAPAWFVIHRDGRVRDLAHAEWPARPWTEVCASALGLPAPQAPSPASFAR